MIGAMQELTEFDAIFFMPTDNNNIHIQSNVYKNKGTPVESTDVGNKWHIILFQDDGEDDEEVFVKRHNENDPIHVSDLIRGIKNVDDHGATGETYNLSYSEARTDNETALIIKMLTNSSSLISYDFDSVSKKGVLDISKARDKVGFKPKLDVIYGLRDYIDWVKKYDHL
jgi:nucleoside-diphosphate-sugar epimerase